MNALLTLFINNLLPVVLAAAAGYLLARVLQVNPRPLSQVAFYIFSPCLVFNLLTRSQLQGDDILRMLLFSGSTIVCVGLIAGLAAKILRLERRMLSAVLLTSMFMNAGNYGLPVILFAFGEATLSYATLYFVTMAALTYTLGVLIASMGTAGLGHSLLQLFKIPTIYALLLALLFLRTGWQLPLPIERTANLLGDASIPSMLVLLGLQLQRVTWSDRYGPLALANGLRLLIGPAIALGLSQVFGLSGPARLAGVVEAGMPTAVLAIVLATEYDVEPGFVTSAVFTSTLLSPLTLTPLLALMGG